MSDLMIDIEALGKHANSVILTIGAQQFDPSVMGWETRPQMNVANREYYTPYINIRVDVDEQEVLGRLIDQETLDWWVKQEPIAKEDAFSTEDRFSLKQALTELSLLASPCKRIWSKGPVYDIVMLENAYEQMRMKIPWKFYNVRDARTVYSLCPKLESEKNGHIALDDCRNQIIMLQKAFSMLGVEQLK